MFNANPSRAQCVQFADRRISPYVQATGEKDPRS